MAKLYFRYGTVNSAKTMNLLSVAHNYKSQGKKILIMKPKMDTRTGNLVYSRTGLQITADILIDEKSDLVNYVSILLSKNDAKKEINNNTDIKNSLDTDENEIFCILVDEAQFLSRNIIMSLRFIATYLNIPVICYGLRTNFKSELFEGSNALFCLADSIEEIKNTCKYCNKKGTFNLKVKNTSNEDEIQLGFEDLYVSSCFKHYFSYVED
jgi:thymidine kinase